MFRMMRIFLFLVSCGQLLAAMAFFWQWPFVVDLWPLAGTTPLTFIFLASIFAAAAASTLWAILSGQLGALVGIALDYITILAPLTIFMFLLGQYPLSLFFAIGVLLGLALLLWSIRKPIDQTIALPRPVYWSFIFFIIALLIVSSQLIRGVPNIIPWQITPELSVVIGWMFLGAAFYFGYSLIRPSWNNAAGQLAGFLAYDIVLIVPFLQRLPGVAPGFRNGLITYLIVIIYSGALAIFYLFIHRPTRLSYG